MFDHFDFRIVLIFLFFFHNEAAGIRHNELYSVNCIRIACRSENITGSRFPRNF